MALTRLGPNQSINLATNTTGTLGVANGGTGLTSGTSGQFLKFTGSTTVGSAAVDPGITGYDEWVVTTSFTGDADPISSNWARNSANTFEKIGTGMSQSSGIFTFPETGKWNVEFIVNHANNNGNDRNLGIMIQKTVNNSAYDEAAITETAISRNTSATYYMSETASATLDITDTANRKVRFKVVKVDSNTETAGSASVMRTGVKFTRIGDT